MGYSYAAATGNSLSARLVGGSGLLRVLLGMLAFCRNHFRLGFYWNHFRVVMRTRRVRLARALVLLGAGLRRACPVGPEDEEGRSVQDELGSSGRDAGHGQGYQSGRHLARRAGLPVFRLVARLGLRPDPPVEAISFEAEVPAQWKGFYRINVEFFEGLGSPGGASRVGKTAWDHPAVAALPPQR